MNWHLPFEQRFSDDRALEEMPRYQFVTNFYQGFGLSFIAVLSQDVPSVRFYPQSSQSLQDISAARVASDVATLIEQNNQVEHLLTSIGYFLWTDGKLGAYVRYVADGQRFGFREENILEALEIPLGEDVYACPQCGKESPSGGWRVASDEPDPSVVGQQHAAPHLGNTSGTEAHVAAYAAFERAANEDLERSVGNTIERTLEQALPVAQPLLAVRGADAQAKVPALRERLSAAIRQDIEKALQGDRQLGEQVAQILASRRFDNDTRAQVVRLIGERAQQLVPGAAKRVLNEWTQTTLATHRPRAQRNDTSAARADVAPAPSSARAANEPRRQDAGATNARRVDYRKFSDEQILDMG